MARWPDDTSLTEAVYEAQEAGRGVNCSTAGEGDEARAAVIARWNKTHAGCQYTQDALVEAPIPTPAEREPVHRSLPEYVQGADRSRLVQVLCKGACGRMRWAEMDQPYPGQAVLRVAHVGNYTARCLKCGTVARDPYNWIR